MCLFVSTEYTNVTDGRTDGHRAMAYAALMHSIVQQKPATASDCYYVRCFDA